ncbi:MAG: histidine phosphatase family protein, partial [Proteobacteria bacterium]|nr:histidine phosphatase family protein [Pseudomonadota bacterium]
MSLRLLLARHGDTFNAGEQAIFVGSRNDLPLTETGMAQAHAVGALLGRSALGRFSILSGPLQRTKVFAEVTARYCSPAPPLAIDARLNELDYGSWAGL